jgi:hypothetical protein
MKVRKSSFFNRENSVRCGSERSFSSQEKRRPVGYWENVENQRKCMEEKIATALQVTSPDDWYKVTLRNIKLNGGSSIIEKYTSKYDLLKTIYPEYKWDPFQFNRLPNNYWQKDTLKEYFELVSERVGVKKEEDWYKVTHQQFKRIGGLAESILHKYGSLVNALKVVYPQLEVTDFEKLPKRYFESEENQRRFLTRFAKKYKVEMVEDWLRIRTVMIKREGGTMLLQRYNDNLFDCLSSLYPGILMHLNVPFGDYGIENGMNVMEREKWEGKTSNPLVEISKLSLKSKKRFWREKVNQRNLIGYIVETFGVREKKDWYRLSVVQLREYIGTPLIMSGQNQRDKQFKRYGCDIQSILEVCYPEESWEFRKKQQASKRSVQFALLFQIMKLFPKYWIIEEYKASNITYSESGCNVEIDLFIPTINLGIEYQGEQHYNEMNQWFGPSHLFHSRDKYKDFICNIHSISLVTVPYWWDRSIHSLSSTIINNALSTFQILRSN